MDYDCFELRRLVDGLVYLFDRKQRSDGIVGYQRRDQDLWITFCSQRGWIAYDDESGGVRGRMWDLEPSEQSPDYPPQGIWVSRKAEKSYVYDLVYVTG